MRNTLRRNRRRDTAACGVPMPGNLGIKCERLHSHTGPHYAEPGHSWRTVQPHADDRYFAGYSDTMYRMKRRNTNER